MEEVSTFLDLMIIIWPLCIRLPFGLACHPTALWVQALRQKYRMNAISPLSIARPNCSSLWRALSNGWESVRNNIYWVMGDGNEVHLWNDSCVHCNLRPWINGTSGLSRLCSIL
ncbi:hypothetical protein V6N11_001989 [Hibiscus sabdariffa]|uniref:Uncharacterized protein n=1 Tax=Hibiscus sabdariffa TaxID=183260 RepID=A0ABR2QU37_9ROSI